MKHYVHRKAYHFNSQEELEEHNRFMEKTREAQETNVVLVEEIPSVSLGTKVKNAAKAVGRIGRAISIGSKIRAPKRIRKQRSTICKRCEYWSPNGNLYLGECRHESCGCTKFKHGLTTEKCPLGKW